MTKKITRYTTPLDDMTSNADLVLDHRLDKDTTGPAIAELFRNWLLKKDRGRSIQVEAEEILGDFSKPARLKVDYVVLEGDDVVAATKFEQYFHDPDPFRIRMGTIKCDAIIDLCNQIIARNAGKVGGFTLQNLWR